MFQLFWHMSNTADFPTSTSSQDYFMTNFIACNLAHMTPITYLSYYDNTHILTENVTDSRPICSNVQCSLHLTGIKIILLWCDFDLFKFVCHCWFKKWQVCNFSAWWWRYSSRPRWTKVPFEDDHLKLILIKTSFVVGWLIIRLVANFF